MNAWVIPCTGAVSELLWLQYIVVGDKTQLRALQPVFPLQHPLSHWRRRQKADFPNGPFLLVHTELGFVYNGHFLLVHTELGVVYNGPLLPVHTELAAVCNGSLLLVHRVSSVQ